MAINCPKCGHQYDVTLFSLENEVSCDCGTRFGIDQGNVVTIQSSIDGVLIDIGGVLHVGDKPIEGAAQAIEDLKRAGLLVRFLTNTTRSTRRQLFEKLREMDFDIDIDELFTAPIATRQYLEQNLLRPYFLIHPALQPEFSGIETEMPNAVVVGDAGDGFTYAAMNKAFRILVEGGALISMGSNRFFQEANGLSMDMGPFVEALRFASGTEPIVLGKPSTAFFRQALQDMDVAAGNAVMIGDDLENDIGGAQAAGIRGILVRTGKYRRADETESIVKPDRITDDISTAVREILGSRATPP